MLPALLAMALVGMASLLAPRKPKAAGPSEPSFREDESGALNMGAVLGVIFALVGSIVIFLVLSDMVDPFLTALGSFLGALVDVEIGDSQAANITEIVIESFAILVGIGGAAFLVGYGLRAAGVGKKA